MHFWPNSPSQSFTFKFGKGSIHKRGAELPSKLALQEVWQQVATFPPPKEPKRPSRTALLLRETGLSSDCSTEPSQLRPDRAAGPGSIRHQSNLRPHLVMAPVRAHRVKTLFSLPSQAVRFSRCELKECSTRQHLHLIREDGRVCPLKRSFPSGVTKNKQRF